LRLIISKAAQADINEAALWYNTKQAGLGKRFTSTIRKEVKTIISNPELFPAKYNDVRTAAVSVFPYMIHYRVDTGLRQMTIIAVFHTSLNPKNWK
jgi:plasmid stabilization system protein ParE